MVGFTEPFFDKDKIGAAAESAFAYALKDTPVLQKALLEQDSDTRTTVLASLRTSAIEYMRNLLPVFLESEKLADNPTRETAFKTLASDLQTLISANYYTSQESAIGEHEVKPAEIPSIAQKAALSVEKAVQEKLSQAFSKADESTEKKNTSWLSRTDVPGIASRTV